MSNGASVWPTKMFAAVESVSAPDVLNKDSYQEGWMLRMRVSNAAELKNLLSAKDYRKLLAAGE